MAKAGDSKKALKEIYRTGSERAAMALQMFGNATIDSSAILQSPKDQESIQRLIKSITDAIQFEENSDYKMAILFIGTWLSAAYSENYFQETKTIRPGTAFIMRKGLTVLQNLLLRDHRRSNMSQTERQIYYEFRSLIAARQNPLEANQLVTENNPLSRTK
jgi:hypothetical protein